MGELLGGAQTPPQTPPPPCSEGAKRAGWLRCNHGGILAHVNWIDNIRRLWGSNFLIGSLTGPVSTGARSVIDLIAKEVDHSEHFGMQRHDVFQIQFQIFAVGDVVSHANKTFID